MAGCEIDDAQAAHADGAPALRIKAFVVRPAMADLIAHGTHPAQFRRAVTQHISCNATHKERRRPTAVLSIIAETIASTTVVE